MERARLIYIQAAFQCPQSDKLCKQTPAGCMKCLVQMAVEDLDDLSKDFDVDHMDSPPQEMAEETENTILEEFPEVVQGLVPWNIRAWHCEVEREEGEIE